VAKNPLSLFQADETSIATATPSLSMPAELADLNRTIHEPARLAILTVLSSCATADFTFLQTATGLSKGNLSVQLSRLEEAGFVTIEKTIERKRTLTTVALTKDGRSELDVYWRQMERIRAHGTAAVKPEARKVRARAGMLAPEAPA